MKNLIVIACVLALVACDQVVQPQQTPAATAADITKPAIPVSKSGEWLTVHVDNMELQAFVAALQVQTGARIVTTGHGVSTVTVHVEQASLRQVLAAAFADRPYQATMQYSNLQDSFPAQVEITFYGAEPATVTNKTDVVPAAGEPAPKTREQLREEERRQHAMNPPARDVEAEAFYAMSGTSQTDYFLQQTEDRQAALASGMEATASTVPWMAEMLARQDVSSAVKAALLDSLQLGDYATSLPAIQTALASSDSTVVVRGIEAIGQLGSQQDVTALQKIARDHPDSVVREAAQDAIDMLGL